MSGVQKYYLNGAQRLESTSAACVKSFRIDAGAQAAGTATTMPFNKGDQILCFVAKVTEAVTSAGSPTVQLGFSSTTMLSAATAMTSLDAIGDVLGPDNSADAACYTLTADDTFDCIVGVATLTAGKFDVHVTYVPAPDGVCDSSFKEYTTT